MVEHLTLENFESEVVNSDVPVVLDFYADWCGPCQMMGPVFESVSEEFDGKVKFLKVDTSSEEGLAMKFGVRGIPNLVFLRDGEVVGNQTGFLPEDALIAKVKQVFSL